MCMPKVTNKTVQVVEHQITDLNKYSYVYIYILY